MIKLIDNNEIFKNIHNSNYMISNYGRVYRKSYKKWCKQNNSWSNMKGIIKKQTNNNSKKYWRIEIFYLDGSKKWQTIHRLVALYFINNPTNKNYVNHIDGNKNNNHVSNLEWVTNQENMDHRYKVLKKFNNLHGSKNTRSKLNELQALNIANRILAEESYNSILKDYPFISKSTLSEIKSGRSWRHLNKFTPKPIKSEKYFDLRYDPVVNES